MQATDLCELQRCSIPLLLLILITCQHSSSAFDCTDGNCLSLGSQSSIEITGASSIVLGAQFGPPYPSTCRDAWDENYINTNGLYGSGTYLLANAPGDGDDSVEEYVPVYCTMPPIPTSCKDAKLNGFKNTQSTTLSGTYIIQPITTSSVNSTLSVSSAFEVYCEMDLNDGGWTLISNVRSSAGWIPPTGDRNYGSFSPDFSFNDPGYDPTWTSDVTFFRSFSGLNHTEFMFVTKDKSYWCALEARSLRQPNTTAWALNDTHRPNTLVLASSSSLSSSSQTVPAGGYTNIFFTSTTASTFQPFVGCAGPAGTFENNTLAMLWSEVGIRSFQYAGFKNLHGGVGVFIR
eukprot:c9618_g1_i1.p1 GENE.c9618_g1_i1~~c9618_g1_i1.p1  ORF type:complete len:347 (-),score=62.81 c9618_g1_i1:189-1229(-)